MKNKFFPVIIGGILLGNLKNSKNLNRNLTDADALDILTNKYTVDWDGDEDGDVTYISIANNKLTSFPKEILNLTKYSVEICFMSFMSMLY